MRPNILSLSLLLAHASVSGLAVADGSSHEAQVKSGNDLDSAVEGAYVDADVQMAQNPLNMASMQSMSQQDSPRHRQEKVHLMKRMDRKNGKWGTTHPRYRLLEALYSFTKYRERNMAELDRWRSLYKNVGKNQKQVSRHL